MDRLLPARRGALTVAAVCVAAMGLLGWSVAGETGDGPLDSVVFGLLTGHPGITGPLLLCTHPVAMAAVIAVVAGVALWRGSARVAVLAVVAPTAAAAVNTWALKPLFDRTHAGYLAYPSGHTTTLVAVLAVIMLVIAVHAPRGPAVRAGLVAAGAAAVGVLPIISREYHYLADTVGATFWAVAAVIVSAALVDAVAERVGDPRTVRQAQETSGP